MKKWVVVIVCLMMLSSQVAFAANELMIADFDTGDKPNNLGGDFGAWDKDPNDDTQTCAVSFNFGDDPTGNTDGYSLQMDYDVDSPNPAYNGFWTTLEGKDFSVLYQSESYPVINSLTPEAPFGFPTFFKKSPPFLFRAIIGCFSQTTPSVLRKNREEYFPISEVIFLSCLRYREIIIP